MMGLGNVGGLGRLGYAAANSVGWWLSEAQLDLDFANDRSYNRKTGYQASPNGLLTYTSPSPKMVYGDDGVLGYARHNLLRYSEQFDNAAWSASGSITVTANQTVAPDRTTTADKFVTAGSASVRQSVTVTAGTTYTFSFFAKNNGGTIARYRVYDNTNLAEIVAPTSYFSQISGDEWTRIEVTFTTPSGCVSAAVYPTSNTAGVNIYVWGGQLNRGSTALDYLATTSAAKYDLPIDHDPLTGEALGVLIEEQRTNLLLQSQALASTWLISGSVTRASDAEIAPDGTLTADTISTGGGRDGVYQVATVTNGAVHTWSVFVKAISGPTKCYIGVESTPAASVVFDAATGALSSPGAGLTSYSAVQLPNNWWRVQGTYTAGSTSDVVTLYTNDAGATVMAFWGAQLEAGAFATSYIQTGSAQVTRAADNIKLLTSAFNFSDSAGTILTESDVDATSGTHHVFALHDGSNNERSVLRSIDAAMNYAISDGGVLQASNNVSGTVQARQVNSVAFAFAVNDIALSMDGGSITSDTSATLPTVTTLSLGAAYYTGLDQINGHIKRLTYWNSRKPNAELQALSA